MGAIGKCKLCGDHAALVDAHVIPNSFYAPVLSREGYGIRVPASPDNYESRFGTGEYDPNLVCLRCERGFSEWDGYGKRFLLDRDWSPVPGRLEPFIEVAEWDHALLKMFVLSVAWRVGASNRPFFSQVSLGHHLSRLGAAVRASDPGGTDFYSVILAKFRGPSSAHPELDPKHGWMNPFQKKMGDRMCLQMYLADFVVIVKMDQRPFPSELYRFCMAPDRPLFVLLRDFERSGELRAMWQTMQERK